MTFRGLVLGSKSRSITHQGSIAWRGPTGREGKRLCKRRGRHGYLVYFISETIRLFNSSLEEELALGLLSLLLNLEEYVALEEVCGRDLLLGLAKLAMELVLVSKARLASSVHAFGIASPWPGLDINPQLPYVYYDNTNISMVGVEHHVPDYSIKRLATGGRRSFIELCDLSPRISSTNEYIRLRSFLMVVLGYRRNKQLIDRPLYHPNMVPSILQYTASCGSDLDLGPHVFGLTLAVRRGLSLPVREVIFGKTRNSRLICIGSVRVMACVTA
nr:hypothetical protein Iba_chr03cCG7490 [Ipomoea batatas]